MKSSIEQRVMANVGTIYTARQFVSASALKLYVLLAGLYTLVQLTWVHKVFANWSAVGFGRTFQFFSYAIIHTHPLVQVTLALTTVAGILLVRDLVRPSHTHSLSFS
ncbi:MAG TPA: hypothetical protein VIY48_04080 [Candidatus Paceibacterota bacterium]